LIYQFRNEGEQVAILDYNGVQHVIVLYKMKGFILLLMKKTGEAMGDFEGWICPDARFSWMNAFNLACSFRASG
jgi:hypothetical protein